ncbi:MAG: hypothetical protein MR889_02640 [Clostridiales bacterium]|nr:hypothetical protein [Clostridiales bacterium]
MRTERLYYLKADEATGETLNDAVYKRNLAIEQRFVVKLNYHDVASDKGLFTKAVESSVMADDEGYDIICPDYWWGLDTSGYFLDLNSLDYLNFDKPWWNKAWNEHATISGECYTSVGYLCLDLLRNTEVVYFNKKMIDQYKLDNPYELVKDNKWTIDKVSEMGQSVAGDVDGNGVIDENDRFGLYINEHERSALYYSLGFSLISNKNGDLSINPLSERDTALNELIVKLFNNNNSNLIGKDVTVDFMTTAAYKPFNQNNLLFTFFALTSVEAMRMTDVEFGIVPVPKFDTEQVWISSNYGCTLAAIPVNTPDVDRSAIILEALNAESYRSVTPVYYESVLKGKLARDNDSEEMLDMIFGNLQFDFGFIHSNHLSGIPADFTAGTDTDMASKYASKLETLKGKLEELQKAYDEMK